MGVLHRYITVDFLIVFGLTVLTFTFVMCTAALVRAIDLMARGVSAVAILKIIGYNIPFVLMYSIPMSVMTSVLLQFSRLSLDGELNAMRACGLSMWQITSPIILASIILSFVCIYISGWVAPACRFAERQILHELSAEDPVNLLEEQRFIRDFPGLMIYVGKKNQNKVEDVVVYEIGPEGVKQHVRARAGEINVDHEKKELVVDLFGVRIDRPDPENPLDPSRTRSVTAARYPVRLDMSKVLDRKNVQKRGKDMTLVELLVAIKNVRKSNPGISEDLLKEREMKLVVTANTGLALSMSCFAFCLIGIPLGMKSRRKESSIGIGMSLVVIFLFYAFIIAAESTVAYPELRPDLIIWIPVVVSQLGGFYFLTKKN